MVPFIRRYQSYFAIPRYSKTLLRTLFESISTKYSQHIDKLPNIMGVFYNFDCLAEDELFNYYENLSLDQELSHQIKIKIAPFVSWLKS